MRKPMPFGKYLLLDRIAVGGMAEVFAAKTFGVEGFERVVAIKRILPTMVEDDEFISMFIDEARIASMLNHANIVQIYELGKHDDTYFISMEYVSGRDVRMLIDKYKKRGQAMPIDLACYVVAKVAEGLDYAHRKKDQSGRDLGIIHRDISPQNVLVSYEGEVKIIDLGIAKAAGRLQKTQAGILKGKFGYMSPEQVRGIPIDHRSDIYSAGVMLYEMLTGTKLFTGESDFSTLEKVRAGDVRPPSELNPDIPPALEAVVMKALAKDRDQRYQWAGEFAEALLHHLFSASSGIFSNSKLAAFMRDAFGDELRKEQERIRRWADSERPPGSEATSSPPQHAPAAALAAAAAAAAAADAKVRIGPPSAFMTSELRLQERTNVGGTPFAEEAPAPRGYGSRRPPPPVNEAVTEAASLADLGMAAGNDAAADLTDRPTQVKPAPEPPRRNSKIQKGLKTAPPAFSPDETIPPDAVDVAEVNAAAARIAPAAEQAREVSRPFPDLAHPPPSKLPVVAAVVGLLLVLLLAAVLFKDELARLGGPGTGTLLLSVSPTKGLEITIDGILVGTSSPASARLPYGDHAIEVKAEGYRPFAGTVTLSGRTLTFPPITLEEVAAPPPPEPEPEPEPEPTPTRDTRKTRTSRTQPAPAPAPTKTAAKSGTRTEPVVAAPEPAADTSTGPGALMVFSAPKGARIIVDGKPRGTTPLKVAELPTNRDVEVRLELDGYVAQSRRERASEGTARMVKFELAPAAAAPAAAPAPATTTAAKAPAPEAGGALVKVIGLCRPASQVHVDGKDTGRSSPIFPNKPLELTAGRHTIACVNADGRRKEQAIDLASGQAQFKFDISLGE